MLDLLTYHIMRVRRRKSYQQRAAATSLRDMTARQIPSRVIRPFDTVFEVPDVSAREVCIRFEFLSRMRDQDFSIRTSERLGTSA